jgi:hypothetical protein
MKLIKKIITNNLIKRNFFISRKMFLKEITKNNFESEITLSKVPVVLDGNFSKTNKKVFADWCG